jgi:hypothetical protein
MKDTHGAIEEILALVGAEKSAEANTEAGGYQGSTTHPVKDVDDRTDDAQEGARSSENTSDVKEDQGAPGVDSTAEGTPGGQDSVQMDVGITSKATGEDSTNEDDYKDGKEDGGYQGASTHPARTDNNALDGHKYSSLLEASELFKQAEEAGKQFLAAVAVEAEGDTQKQAQELAKSQAKKAEEECEEEEEEEKEAAKAASRSAYDLAGVFIGTETPEDDIKAASVGVTEVLGSVIDLADYRSEKLARFYHKMAAAEEARRKQANGEEGEEEGESSENPTEGGSEEAPEGAAAEGMPPAEDPAASGGEVPVEGGGGDEDIMALLTGGEEMGAEDALGGMGDMPPEGGDPAAAMGGDPAAMGADPMAGGEGGAPGGLSEEQLLPLLLQLLQQDPSMMEQATDKIASQILDEIKGATSSKISDEKQAQVKSALKEILGRR